MSMRKSDEPVCGSTRACWRRNSVATAASRQVDSARRRLALWTVVASSSRPACSSRLSVFGINERGLEQHLPQLPPLSSVLLWHISSVVVHLARKGMWRAFSSLLLLREPGRKRESCSFSGTSPGLCLDWLRWQNRPHETQQNTFFCKKKNNCKVGCFFL